ncbi:MAG TPA: MmcB family DNA repair protein [Methylomirabilota bacterium]|nr:MmcB family DNA repair protein [Methylomirabilota bacterium]
MPEPVAAFFSVEARLVDGRQSEPARLVQRGVGRLLVGLGFSIVYELPLASGRRADVTALSPSGEVWIVEIKSSVEDYRVDRKWPEYRLHCDRLFFATHGTVPLDIFPAEAGLMVADGYGAEILRHAPEVRLPPATRKAVTLRFAHAAARRFHALVDPGVAGSLL